MSADVVFVIPNASATELDRMHALDVDRDWRFFENGVAAWIVQTYLILRDNGLPVKLGNSFSKNAINIAHVCQLTQVDRPRGCFVVGVRADYPPVRWCQLHIVQNKTQIGRQSLWLPHWPQPGLIPRDQSRGHKVKRLGYFGRSVNYYSRFFRRACGYFRVRDAIQDIAYKLNLYVVERGPECWNDFQDVDVVIGIREFGSKTFDTKPPTKMINAWLAGTAFIAGADSAYKQIGVAGKDFIAVTSSTDLEATIVSFINDDSRYLSLITGGALKACHFNRESVIVSWKEVLRKLLVQNTEYKQ